MPTPSPSRQGSRNSKPNVAVHSNDQHARILEETGLHGAGAAEGNVSAGKARVTIGEDLSLVGLEDLLGGVAVHGPDVGGVEGGVHLLFGEKTRMVWRKGEERSVVSSPKNCHSTTTEETIHFLETTLHNGASAILSV